MASADQLIEIFNAAKLRPAGPERDAFLAEACGDDVELKEQVRSLLKAHDKAGGFLQGQPELSPTLETEFVRLKPEKAGGRIGPYTLREQIGEGGFGTVWVAEQQPPVRRTVALKIIKLGMDTKDVVARFGQERQALAMMDHPNIAKVFDAGATQEGRPYFVMELVRGIKITDYCDQANLPTPERLALFMQVCHAVQHAHQKGIIHRDLKPSNILVTLQDGVPVPKVIDFGVAKATQGPLTELTIYTRALEMVGTPLYMSPEQAEMNGLDVDTRTDIYALGVLLYELLTGRTPFDADTLRKAGYDEVRRIIREQEPQKPSTALHTMAQGTLTSVAHHRASEPPKLIHAIRGDLDWIVMKTLEKDRARRYETANGLAADIRRHLTNELVVARPPSRAYQLQKLVHRNKLAFLSAAAIIAALLVGLTSATWMYLRESAARKRATLAEKLAKERLAEVSAERDAKEVARQEAEAISTFMSEVFQSPNPTRDGRTITVAETLDKAAKKLETDLTEQPAQRARFQSTLGQTYHALGLSRQAVPLQERVLRYHRTASGPEHPNTLTAMHDLAVYYVYVRRLDEALKLLEEVLPLRRKVLGPEHPATLWSMSALANSYAAIGRRDGVLARQDPATPTSMSSLATSQAAIGLRDEALKLRKELLRLHHRVLGPEHFNTLAAMSYLSDSYWDTGQRDEALKLREELLPLHRKVLGPAHPQTLWTIHTLAESYHDSGRRDEALKLREKVLALRRKVLGPEDPATFWAMHKLADSYATAGRQDEALKLREEALPLFRKVLGPDHPAPLTAMQSLANSYVTAGREDEALKLREDVLAQHCKLFGPEHPDTILAMLHLADSCHDAGRKDEALNMREEVLKLFRKEHAESLYTLRAMYHLAESYYAAGRRDEALKLREEALVLSRKVHGPEHPDTLWAINHLAYVCFAVGRRDEALKLREELLNLRRKVLGPEHRDTLAAMRYLADSYQDAGRNNEALKLLEEALPRFRKVLGPEDPATLQAMHNLANSYQANGDIAKAQTLEKEVGIAKVKALWGDRAEDSRVTRLCASGLKEKNIQKQADGTWSVDLNGLKDFADLTIFQGTRVSRLTLKGTAVTDLTPLRGLALKQLNLEKTKVTDLAPLQGMPIEDLTLNFVAISNLTDLRGLPLQKLELNLTPVADLEPLRGMALKHLAIHGTKVTDLKPLEGMPLEYLNLKSTAVTDLSVLRRMPLTNLRLFDCEQLTDLSPLAEARGLTLLTLPATAKDIEFLRTFPKLERLSFTEATPTTWLPAQTTAEFWERYARKSPAGDQPANASPRPTRK